MHLWQGYHRCDPVFFPMHPFKWHAVLKCSTTDDVRIDHLIKVMSAKFLRCKVTSFFSFHTPWTKEPGRLQSMGSQRVQQDWARTHTHTDTHTFKGAELSPTSSREGYCGNLQDASFAPHLCVHSSIYPYLCGLENIPSLLCNSVRYFCCSDCSRFGHW